MALPFRQFNLFAGRIHLRERDVGKEIAMRFRGKQPKNSLQSATDSYANLRDQIERSIASRS